MRPLDEESTSLQKVDDVKDRPVEDYPGITGVAGMLGRGTIRGVGSLTAHSGAEKVPLR
jgi:hypothetical protein